jgi:four helix bundle protein
MQDYRKLVVWQRAHQFVLALYAATRAFPEEERYGLTSQTRRAALSIPANIAEGCGRETAAEFRRFLYVAMGSAREVDYYLLLARDLGLVDETLGKRLMNDLDEIQRMLKTLINRLSESQGGSH